MKDLKRITVTKKGEAFLREGRLWVYDAEVLQQDEGIGNGDVVNVYSEKDRFLGAGFYNDRSKIRVRLLSKNMNDAFDAAFFARRVRWAVDYRATVNDGDLSATRLIFGDADGLPGLIADKFGKVLVTQIMCLGIEQRKDAIFSALLDVLKEKGEEIDCIYERNDVEVRKKEGLAAGKGYYIAPGLKTDADGLSGKTQIVENGVKYVVDYIDGQKTGFFLDQKYNRAAASSIAKGKTVLDCFTHIGAFALNCAKAGARSVTAVDISETATLQTRENVALNGFTNVDVLCADVFDYLDALYETKTKPYDYIILDPPAFTKSRKTVDSAFHGYKQINLKAMRLLPRGGYLATCSCSHFMTDALFRKMLLEAASEANVQLKIVEYRQQAKDHPVLLGVPETEYLGFYILQVV